MLATKGRLDRRHHVGPWMLCIPIGPDVIMVGPWMLSPQDGLDHGSCHVCAMDAFHSTRIGVRTSWLGHGVLSDQDRLDHGCHLV